MSFFLSLVVHGLAIGAVYGLVAMGFVLIYKSSKIVNLAQGELLLLGAYLCWSLISQFGLPPWIAVLLVIIIGGLLGLGLERFPFRPVMGQSWVTFLILTFAIGYVIRGTVFAIWGAGFIKNYPEDFFPTSTGITIGDVSLNLPVLISIGLVIMCLVGLHVFFNRSWFGLGMKITSEDHQLAESVGIKVSTNIALAWVLGCILGGVSGILVGKMTLLSTELSFIGYKSLPAVIVGGLESVPGAVIGGLIIGVSEYLCGGYIGHGVKEMVPYIILLIVLLIRPYGLFGWRKIERI